MKSLTSKAIFVALVVAGVIGAMALITRSKTVANFIAGDK